MRRELIPDYHKLVRNDTYNQIIFKRKNTVNISKEPNQESQTPARTGLLSNIKPKSPKININ